MKWSQQQRALFQYSKQYLNCFLSTARWTSAGSNIKRGLDCVRSRSLVPDHRGWRPPPDERHVDKPRINAGSSTSPHGDHSFLRLPGERSLSLPLPRAVSRDSIASNHHLGANGASLYRGCVAGGAGRKRGHWREASRGEMCRLTDRNWLS